MTTEDGDAGLRAVIALGGDGTASSVRSRAPLGVPIVPVPLGTENLLARYVGQGARGSAVRQTLDRGVVIRLDLGRANGQYFLLMISAGFDAEVIRRLHENRRGNITRATYLKPTLQAIRSYRYPELQLYCEPGIAGLAPPIACRWVFGFSLPLYALGWQLAPQADGTDGLFDVCTFRQGSLRHGLRYLWHVLRGSHLALDEVSLSRQRRFRIEVGKGVAVPYQLDGDYAGNLPVEVEVLPGELRLLVSRAAATRLGFDVAESD
jgi:diacylglycerol kinase family enzyme